MVHTFKLPLTELYIGTTALRIPQDHDEPEYELEWHPAGSSLYITVPRFPEIDLRFDREVFEIFFQDPSQEAETAMIALRLWQTRPLEWKNRVDFCPGFTGHNRIIIVVKRDVNTYLRLTRWMINNSYNGKARCCSVMGAEWDELKDVLTCSYGFLEQSDVTRLQPGQWANDTLIEFGLNYVATPIKEAKPNCPFVTVSPLIWPHFSSQGFSLAVKRMSKFNLFEQEFAIFIIPSSGHFYLLIFDKPRYAIKGVEGDTAKIYVLDSFPSDISTRGIRELRRYIKDFAVFKGVGELDDIEEYRAKVPLQRNFFDCGYYCIHFAKTFCSDPEKYRPIIMAEDPKTRDKWGKPHKMRHELREYVMKQIKS